jgi:two-component system sensor histidine kinase PilS (NtrC family)
MTSRPPPSDLGRGLAILLILRAAVVAVLLGATVVVNAGSLLAFETPTTRFLLLLVAGTFLLTGVYAILHPRFKERAAFAQVQLALDAVGWTALVYATGGAGSGFTFLYGLEIVLGAALLGRTGALFVAVASWLLLAALTTAMSMGFVPPLPDQGDTFVRMPAGEVAYQLLVNGVMVLLVATLAGTLAERVRRAGARVEKAEESAARAIRREEDIVRSVTSGLLTVGLDGAVETVNPAGLSILARPLEDVRGRPLREILPAVGEAARGEGEHERPDGTTVPIGFSVSPLTDEAGVGEGRIVVFQDMTETIGMRRAVENAERLAAVGRVAAGLAHEIRNPLGAISGSVEMLKGASALEAEDRELLALVLDETRRLDGLVTDVLDLARPRAPQRVRVDVASLVRDVATIFRRGTSAYGVAVEVDAPPSLEAEVDPAQLRQVLWNLLKNGAQATRNGAPVRVVLSAEGRALRLEVSDAGTGVLPEDRGRIFDAFHSGRDQGIGIGLALVKQIVEAHGGHVELESEVGKGSSFRVILPA